MRPVDPMAIKVKGKVRGVAIWLSAILFCLSVLAPAHSLEHLDEGATTHCTLCIQKLQLNSVLPVGEFSFSLPSLTVEVPLREPTALAAVHVDYFQSRAPPAQS